MALNFGDVKYITIPEGSVTKITINNVDVWTGNAGAVVPSSDWSYGFQNKYWYTNNKAFWNLIHNNAGEATQVTVKLTVNVYNPTDDATYTSEKTNTLTLRDNGDWKNPAFNISIQYAENSRVTAYTTFNCTNGSSGSSYGNILFNTGLGVVADAGCTIGDISLELIS